MGCNNDSTNNRQDNKMLSKKDPNQTFTGPDMQGHLKDCTSQYPYNPTAELVFCYKQLVIFG